MTPAPTAPPPGSMTVPPLFGWEHILIALALIALAGVTALVLLAAGKAASSRNDWQAWLDGRSARASERSAVVVDHEPSSDSISGGDASPGSPV
jgi:hypothetical protein